jgi:Zn-dependent protease
MTPWFWVTSAALGIRYYADPEAGTWGYFAFWMIAVLICVLLHELGHALVVRRFGGPVAVVLHAFGGLTLGLEHLPRRGQRLLALLAGPAVNLGMLAGLWAIITFLPFPSFIAEQGWQTPVATAIFILFRINFWWAALNLVPLEPLDGGRIWCEVGEGLFGARGRRLAQVLFLLTATLLVVALTLDLSRRLEDRFDPRYTLHLQAFAVLLIYLFAFWVRGFEALLFGQHETDSDISRNRG